MATMSFVHSFMIDFPMFILLQAMVEAEALDHKVDLVAAEEVRLVLRVVAINC